MINWKEDVVKVTHGLTVVKYVMWLLIYKIMCENQAAVLAQWKFSAFDVLGHFNGKENSSTRLTDLCPGPEALE